MTVAEIESQLALLNRAEKAHLVQKLVHDIANTWPGIEKTAGIVGGGSTYCPYTYSCMGLRKLSSIRLK